MREPFEPIGELARWRVLYKVLAGKSVGTVLNYDELAALLSLDPVLDRQTIRMAARRAGQELEQIDKHAIEAVRTVGYRIVEPPEHMRLARGQQRRSHRALARGQSKVINVDLSKLDPETRKAFELTAQGFALQLDFNRRFDVRQQRFDRVMSEVVVRTDRTAEEVAEMRERLARLERDRTAS